MKKLYFLIPVVGVVVFAGFYWSFLSDFRQVEEQRQVAEQKIRDEKLAKELADRRRAYDEAIALADKRKKEREAREEKERLEKEALDQLVEARNRANNEQSRMQNQVRRLNDEVKVEREAVEKLQALLKSQQAEIDGLQVYVKQAEANEKGFEAVLKKIEDADKAAAEAARAAAAKRS